MRLLSNIFTIVLLWQTTHTAKTKFDDDGNVSEVTLGYAESYPASVTAPLPEDGHGPDFDPFPAPHTFTKLALLGAHKQALNKQGDGATYPKRWVTNGVYSPYMEFPISPSGSPWTGHDPGRFRLLYGSSDNKFYSVVMHMYSKEPPKINGIQYQPDWKSIVLYYKN